MFRALLVHSQEALHKGHLVYCVRKCIMSAGCGQLTLYTYARNIPNSVCATPPEEEQVKLEICRAF
jgi:hypothetical protein